MLSRVSTWRVRSGCLDTTPLPPLSRVRFAGVRRWWRFRNRWANQRSIFKEFHDVCGVSMITPSLMFFAVMLCTPGLVLLCCCCIYVYHLRRGRNAIGDMDGASLLSARVVVSGIVRRDIQMSTTKTIVRVPAAGPSRRPRTGLSCLRTRTVCCVREASTIYCPVCNSVQYVEDCALRVALVVYEL